MNSQLKQHVRILYKAILKLHRGLPPELRALGDGYLKQEFQKHKHARQHEVGVFMHEWTKYYISLAKQLTPKQKTRLIGDDMSSEMLSNFSKGQVNQLKELFMVTSELGVSSPAHK